MRSHHKYEMWGQKVQSMFLGLELEPSVSNLKAHERIATGEAGGNSPRRDVSSAWRSE